MKFVVNQKHFVKYVQPKCQYCKIIYYQYRFSD